jgi:hypothetical protein
LEGWQVTLTLTALPNIRFWRFFLCMRRLNLRMSWFRSCVTSAQGWVREYGEAFPFLGRFVLVQIDEEMKSFPLKSSSRTSRHVAHPSLPTIPSIF